MRENTSEQNHKLVMLAVTTTARVSVTQSRRPDQNDSYGNQGSIHLHQERVRANTHTQGCLKMYLDAVHNKLLLVVSFKIYTFQIYAMRSNVPATAENDFGTVYTMVSH